MAAFSPLRLIAEVKKRPGLYNNECKVDRDDKLVLWKEVGAALYHDWGECNKATAYDRVLQVQRKWRSLRDAYNRELRSRRSGVRVNQRVYMYFGKMSFLGGFEGIPPVSDENDADDDNADAMLDNSSNQDPLPTQEVFVVKKPKKRRVKKASIQSEPPEELEMSFPADICENESDSDRLFLLSFLPEMRQLSLSGKMWARAQIANIMQEAVARYYSRGSSVDRNGLGAKLKRHRRNSSSSE